MNRQEAIEILTGLYRVPVENGADEFASEINKAIDMAIDALNHQTVFEQIKWERDMALQVLQGRYTPKGWFGEVEGKENEESDSE